jgi:hypothetical protein
LIGKAGRGRELVEDITPALGTVERGVDDGKAGDEPDVFEIAQPLAIFGTELAAGPVDGFGRVGVETLQVFVGRAVFVVVTLDAGHAHAAHDIEAFLGVGVVADDVTEATIVGALLLFCVVQNDVERLEVGVNVCDDRVSHAALLYYRTISKPRNSFLAGSQRVSSRRIK